jgi:hypothetical protein
LSFEAGTVNKVYNMLIMNLIVLTRKHWSTYEVFSSDRHCSDELKGSSRNDGK